MIIEIKNRVLESKLTIYYKIILVLLFSRAILFFVGFTSRYLLHPDDSLINNMIGIWAQWDAGWYDNIAEKGYATDYGYNPYFGNQANYAFFPLYPMLIRFLVVLFNLKDYNVAGIIISNVFFVISSIYLYKISRLYYDEKQSFQVFLWFVAFPANFLFSCVLTEALYFSLVLICFYYAKKNKWFIVGLSGFFLALTRNLGVFIIVPLLLQYLVNVKFKLFEIKYNVIYLLMIPAGFVAWGGYLYHITGDFLMFKNVQNTWGRISSQPISVIYNTIMNGRYLDLILVFYIIGIIVFLLLNIKKIQVPYLLFIVYSLYIPLSTSVTSMIRYSIVIFPIYFLIMSAFKNEHAKYLLLYFMLLIQGLFFAFWSSGYPLIF
ncbi:hypothetical protein [Paenibacillus typhae]|uniref:Mannosyltransferase related to Gpi18 n=1 Tax=Paenibacillus typhae TaxID=1174501 RepID=A0A1G8NKR4_9BACL|nr:hypothetical protein [Paenibacillus typhae]SDI80794.1 hypothetical protein SAMN05216192_108169 [Paenibacillus typhae]